MKTKPVFEQWSFKKIRTRDEAQEVILSSDAPL
jgi:hypothetical protein